VRYTISKNRRCLGKRVSSVDVVSVAGGCMCIFLTFMFVCLQADMEGAFSLLDEVESALLVCELPRESYLRLRVRYYSWIARLGGASNRFDSCTS